MSRLVSNQPVRLLKPARRALTGRVSLQNGGTAAFESSLERDWIIALDFDWRVRRLQEQPYSFCYILDGAVRRYTPDVLAEFDDGRAQWTVVYEVKSLEDLRQNWVSLRPRFRAAVKDCKSKGWRFRIVTEKHIRTPYVENIKFLRRYKDVHVQDDHRQALMISLKALGETTPQALLAATWWGVDRRMMALAELWRLIATGEIAASLFEPLTMTTRIWQP